MSHKSALRIVANDSPPSPEAPVHEVSVPEGDLVLRAPHGRIIIEAGTEVEIRAAHNVTIHAPNVDVTAQHASLHVGEATILANTIRTTADVVASVVGRWELRAHRIAEHARVVARDYGVLHTTVVRARTIARDTFHLLAKRTSIVSEEDTVVDGKRVLLG